MIRVIIRVSGAVVKSADFPTQAEVNSWLQRNAEKKTWGSPERWVEASKITTENILDALDSAIIPNPFPAFGEPSTITIYKFAGDYTVEQIDVSQQAALAKARQESILAIDLGMTVVAEIRALNKSKILAGTMTPQQFTALLQDQTAAAIERALWTGSFSTAKALVLSFAGYYTDAEKQVILSKLDSLIAKGL